MKTIREKSSRYVAALVFTFLLAVSATAPAQGVLGGGERDLPGANPHALIGTWDAQVTITNCAGVQLQQFSKLVSFDQSGTATEVSTGAPPSARTTALGIWEATGHLSFRYALRFFLFNATGTHVATSNAKWTVTMGDFNDSYTAEAQIQVVPNTGTPQNLCGTETATRFNPF